jgi:hypothetical protein
MGRVQVLPPYTFIKMGIYLVFIWLKLSKFHILEILEMFEKLNFKYVCKINFFLFTQWNMDPNCIILIIP